MYFRFLVTRWLQFPTISVEEPKLRAWLPAVWLRPRKAGGVVIESQSYHFFPFNSSVNIKVLVRLAGHLYEGRLLCPLPSGVGAPPFKVELSLRRVSCISESVLVCFKV